ncbi:Leucine carboxyl methyltransferase family protein [Trichomonas vaginalis G3]|uniref:Leucine carboxyl methyltransferase 1 n=1 Tax=Trichomonas vaginalis (strain ATCC PRA-98 / G3) TaxID=412133 RepID=A2EY25_TRIV3|nr:protein C-terminal leucine carboxyl O-methyltransferase protein [Trichomonas vaginalis G3]EAY02435.1 Leucine carboxyl methyltransferase family protein [Trichomonas vaginalis G3]KAI5527871.1 protein C-terminal leucine carboxyl O-methyltransferase protein [Trichomonas vaginalis G3]|eukprot:XP_001314693.1 Leucine carboxyl methyltransferase family protein [Trichomonas vaginalis G3]
MINVEGENATVEDTASEVIAFKMSAISKGYYSDKYMKYFAGDILYGSQLPHQNFGTFIRSYMIRYVVKSFFDKFGPKSQVVSLGSGFDTLYWRLRDENIQFSKFIEVDKQFVVAKKQKYLENQVFQPLDNYILCDLDLNLEESTNVLNTLLIPDLPTLFIDEFSLIYLQPQVIQRLLKFFAGKGAFISYGMTNLGDDFGDLIKEGFNDMGIPLYGADFAQSTEEFITKALDIGFECADAQNAVFVVKHKIPIEERKRISRLEYFDDPHEVDFILSHYAFYAAGSEYFIKDLLN